MDHIQCQQDTVNKLCLCLFQTCPFNYLRTGGGGGGLCGQLFWFIRKRSASSRGEKRLDLLLAMQAEADLWLMVMVPRSVSMTLGHVKLQQLVVPNTRRRKNDGKWRASLKDGWTSATPPSHERRLDAWAERSMRCPQWLSTQQLQAFRHVLCILNKVDFICHHVTSLAQAFCSRIPRSFFVQSCAPCHRESLIWPPSRKPASHSFQPCRKPPGTRQQSWRWTAPYYQVAMHGLHIPTPQRPSHTPRRFSSHVPREARARFHSVAQSTTLAKRDQLCRRCVLLCPTAAGRTSLEAANATTSSRARARYVVPARSSSRGPSTSAA